MYAGEVVGLAGLIGAGRTELAHLIIGASPKTSGHVEIDGAIFEFDIVGGDQAERVVEGAAAEEVQEFVVVLRRLLLGDFEVALA